MFKWFKRRIESLREEKYLGRILVIHFVLILLHIMTTKQYDIHYHADLRVGGCALIILVSFIFGRKGYAFAILTYSCSLVYVNNFYNYGSAFFFDNCLQCLSKNQTTGNCYFYGKHVELF